MRFRHASIVAVVLACTIAPLAARAATVTDGNKARGPLDLHQLSGTKHDATAPLTIEIFTYGSWAKSLLAIDGPNRLNVLFQIDKDPKVDFTGEIFFRNTRLHMRITTTGGAFVRLLRVSHPRGDLVRTTIPRGLPNPDGNLRIAATMTYRSGAGVCSATPCQDRIPGRGWLKITAGL
jgi:hypothetical protein